MLRMISTVFAIGLLISSAAHAQSSLSGAWDLAINGPEGPINATANLQQDGETVTGSIDTPQGPAELKGTLKGKTLNIAFAMQTPQGPLDIRVNGEVEGASMKGVIDFGMGMADFTAKKK